MIIQATSTRRHKLIFAKSKDGLQYYPNVCAFKANSEGFFYFLDAKYGTDSMKNTTNLLKKIISLSINGFNNKLKTKP